MSREYARSSPSGVDGTPLAPTRYSLNRAALAKEQGALRKFTEEQDGLIQRLYQVHVEIRLCKERLVSIAKEGKP